MSNIDIKCIRKTENYNESTGTTISEVTFQAVVSGGYDVGAVIGTPQSGVSNLTEKPKSVYNLLSPFTISIADAKAASNYIVGESYSLTLNKAAKNEK